MSRLAYQSSYGGAIFLTIFQENSNHNNHLYLQIKNCKYHNNKAEDGDGAICATQHHLSLETNIFFINNEAYISKQAIFILGQSNVFLKRCTFMI